MGERHEAGWDDDGAEQPVGTVRSWAQRTRGLMTLAARSVADVMVPPMCVACHTPLTQHDCLCAGCWTQIDFIRDPLCDHLGIPLPFDTGGRQFSTAARADPRDYDRARAVAVFHGPIQKLIHGFKYSDRHDGRRMFGRWLGIAGAELLRDVDVIVPVPLNRWRLIERRFNQAAILAVEVARASGIAYAPLALERIKKTTQQVGLTTAERQANVAGAFKVPDARRAEIAGKRVLLIDDVITTGSTVNAAALTLKRAGAIHVDVLALAMVP